MRFWIHEFEVRGHHADHRGRNIIDAHPAADDIVGTSKAGLPLAVADHDDRVGVLRFFSVREPASEQWLDAQRARKTRSESLALQALRRLSAAAFPADVVGDALNASDVLKNLIAFAHGDTVTPCRARAPGRAVGRSEPDRHQA